MKWEFLTRGYGETEGYSNGSIAEFKGNPLQALAREICQNSLDAADSSGKPVIVEFNNTWMAIDDFPGMKSMRDVIGACTKFWKGKGDVNTSTFLHQANRCLKDNVQKFNVLRVSDYNTTGVKGAFSDEDITPWGSLVKGSAFSVKTDEKNAAGSYGIGKAAPFVSSSFQTVFYRTLDTDGAEAALGVARLMAHESITSVPAGEDPVRRSVGYFGVDTSGKPVSGFKELDELNKRNTCGTDLFIPGFTGATSDDKWVKDILKEIVENFLYSVYSGKLEIRVQNRSLTKANLESMLDYIGSRDAKHFYQVIKENPDVLEQKREFHGIGDLRLRLLFAPDLNKKIMVVRSSGMKIARISSLPRMVSYTGFLELQGDEINSFFRAMENPRHNAWEPRRHGNPPKAKQYKEEVESWVIETITAKLIEVSGDESVIDVGDRFNYSSNDGLASDCRTVEKITDITESITTETYIPQTPSSGKISIRDEGGLNSSKTVRGREDPEGDSIGHRHRTGKKKGLNPTGRRVTNDPTGLDSVDIGEGGHLREVLVTARIISQGNGRNKLIYVADEDISLGRIEIVTKGENGKSLKLQVKSVQGANASTEEGRIVIRNVPMHIKQTIEFELSDSSQFAMGVKAYGD